MSQLKQTIQDIEACITPHKNLEDYCSGCSLEKEDGQKPVLVCKKVLEQALRLLKEYDNFLGIGYDPGEAGDNDG